MLIYRRMCQKVRQYGIYFPYVDVDHNIIYYVPEAKR